MFASRAAKICHAQKVVACSRLSGSFCFLMELMHAAGFSAARLKD